MFWTSLVIYLLLYTVTAVAADDVILTTSQLKQIQTLTEQINKDGGGDILPAASKRGSVVNFDLPWFSKWEMPILYDISKEFDSSAVEYIEAAIGHWELHTCVRFQRLSPSPDYRNDAHLLFVNHNGPCSSSFGYTGARPQVIRLGPDCTKDLGEPVHEIGHTLGLIHEHNRPDRDSHVTIHSDHVTPAYKFLLESWWKGSVKDLGAMQDLRKDGKDRGMEEGGDMGEEKHPYDYGSVMHYPGKIFSTDGEDTIVAKDPLFQSSLGQRAGLSFWDAKAVNEAYCKGCTTNLQCQRNGYPDPNKCSVCRCPDGFGGRLCEKVAKSNPGCVGQSDLSLNSNVARCVASPNYFNRFSYFYRDFTACNWMVKAPIGCRIEAYFQGDFGVFAQNTSTGASVCQHWVEMKYTADLSRPGPRFCGSGSNGDGRLTSDNQTMMVTFRTNYRLGPFFERRGFQMCFSLHDPSCLHAV